MIWFLGWGMKRKIIYIAVVGSIFIAFILLLTFLSDNVTNFVEGTEIKEFYFNGEKTDLSYRILKNSKIEKYEYTAYMTSEDIKKGGSEESYYINIYRLASVAYEVYFNGFKLGQNGNYITYSNIWNSYAYFVIPEKIITDNNEIKFVIYSGNELGLSKFPVFITDSINYMKVRDILSLFSAGIPNFILWFTFITFLFLFFFFINIKGEKKYEILFYSLSAFFIFLNTIDYLTINYIFTDILVFKKITIMMMYISVFFMSLAIYRKYKRKFTLYTAFSLFAAILTVSIFSDNLYVYQRIYGIMNFLIVINVLNWSYVSLKYRKDTVDSILIFMSSVFLIAFSLYDTVLIVLGKFSMISYSLFGIMLFLSGMLGMVLNEYIKLQIKISDEQNINKMIYERSIRDSMTGLYTKNYIFEYLENIENYIFFLCDIDNFKNINDKYGHHYGDEAIIKTADIFTKYSCENILCGRFGGDEFIYVMLGSQEKDALAVMNKIKKEINVSGLSISSGGYVKKSGENVEFVFKKADKALYEIKNSGKNNIKLIK